MLDRPGVVSSFSAPFCLGCATQNWTLGMIYENAVKYILQFADFERSSKNRRDEDGFALDRITSLLDRMGTPQATRTTVHVAGSKGKGSTAAIIE